jgi:hypothetical protein
MAFIRHCKRSLCPLAARVLERGTTRPILGLHPRSISWTYGLLRCAKAAPNNYRSDRVSGDPSVIARSPCDEAIQGHNMRGGSIPDGRTAAAGLLRFARNDGQGIGLLVSACRLTRNSEQSVRGSPLCHTRESGYPAGRDAATQGLRAPGGSSKPPKLCQRRGILDARVRGHDTRETPHPGSGCLVQGDRPQAGTNSQ